MMSTSISITHGLRDPNQYALTVNTSNGVFTVLTDRDELEEFQHQLAIALAEGSES